MLLVWESGLDSDANMVVTSRKVCVLLIHVKSRIPATRGASQGFSLLSRYDI